ncbi:MULTISPECIES: ABC transporter permease [unclassified Arthrobacter]|uniref:ABC transporter permease n=1 Tax=unclassified Arthrobacter TaxID=235627 RepID=UPI002E0279DD|nr:MULTISPECIES: ABC transporter permease [unclassified Arthrobacter]MEC5192237.1 ABC-2 type transport system permease protein [Arthrobacter sp. MP_M4]MEC5203721.1 ABC-2 type transport system permease protein [Arthrobacter sp. MP_M7]
MAHQTSTQRPAPVPARPTPVPPKRPFARHNLRTVVDFEFTRTMKKRAFWIATLSIPVVMAVVFALIYLSNSSTAASADAQKTAAVAFTYTDSSALVSADIAAAMGGRPAEDPARALEDVKAGVTDAYFVYPAEPAAQPVKVYGADKGIFENGKYDAVAKQLLAASAQAQVGSPQLIAAASGNVKTEAVTFKDGQPTGGFGSAIPPLMFLLIFYVSIILLSNQMLNSTLEEKENRVTEMILTTLNPTTLIIGKVIALFMVGVVQILVFLTPIAVGFLYFRDKLAIPDLDLSSITFDPGTMIVGALLLIGGFMVFTGVLVAIGAIMPTAKDGGTIFGPLMALIFVPFYAISLIISDPRAPIVQIFTYFPLSAPVTGLLRNSFGTLSPLESTIIIVELFLTGFLILRLAVHLFRYGSIQYSSKLSIAGTFRKRTTPAGK